MREKGGKILGKNIREKGIKILGIKIREKWAKINKYIKNNKKYIYFYCFFIKLTTNLSNTFS